MYWITDVGDFPIMGINQRYWSLYWITDVGDFPIMGIDQKILVVVLDNRCW